MSRQEYYRQYYLKNKDRILKHQKQYYKENKEKILERERIREQRPEAKEKRRIQRRKDRRNPKNQKKLRARKIRDRPDLYPLDDKCAFCPNTTNLQRHHPDYDEPTIYVTCCVQCHPSVDKSTTIL